MTSMPAEQFAERAPERFVTTGLPGLDAILGGLRPGDNVVWRVDHVEDTSVRRAVRLLRGCGRRVVYIRFASHPPVLGTGHTAPSTT
jgi:hypothetical protein